MADSAMLVFSGNGVTRAVPSMPAHRQEQRNPVSGSGNGRNTAESSVMKIISHELPYIMPTSDTISPDELSKTDKLSARPHAQSDHASQVLMDSDSSVYPQFAHTMPNYAKQQRVDAMDSPPEDQISLIYKV
jgi:hypothetical protein